MSNLKNYLVTDRKINDLNEEEATFQLVSRNAATCVVPSTSEVFIKIENDLMQDSNEPDGANSSGSALKLSAQPDWKGTKMFSLECSGFVGNEKSHCGHRDPQVISRNVTKYEHCSNSTITIKEENDFTENQMKPDEDTFSGNVNHAFEIKRNLSSVIEQEPYDDPLEGSAVVWLVQANWEDVKMLNGNSHSVINGMRSGSEQNDECLVEVKNVPKNSSGKADDPLKVIKNQFRKIKEEPPDTMREIVSPSKSTSDKVDVGNIGETGIIIKEEVIEENEEGAQKLSPYCFESPPEQSNNENYDLSFFQHTEFTCDNSKSGEVDFSGSQRLDIYFDHDSTHFVGVSTDVEDMLPRSSVMCTQKSTMEDSSPEFHSCSYDEVYSKIGMSGNVTKHEETLQGNNHSPEQFSEYLSHGWYSCMFCPSRFKLRNSFAQHLLKKHYIYLCVDCDIKFYSQSDLQAHQIKHSGRKLVSCPYCSFQSKTELELRVHVRTHPSQRLFSCGRCFMEFDDSCLLLSHIVLHSNERRFKCAHCSYQFKTKNGIRCHLRIHMNGRSFSCPYCHMMFKWRSSLRHHKLACRRVLKKIPNPEGVTFFETEKVLESHKLERRQASNSTTKHFVISPQDNDRLFPCSRCPASFRQKTSLTEHMKKHNIIKPSFASCADNKKSLEGDHPLNLSGRLPVCQNGVSSFTTSTITEHVPVHMYRKLISCVDCDGRFKSKGDLEKHQKIHAHGYSFGCPYCAMKFKVKDSALRHLTTHFNGKRQFTLPQFSCPDCGDKFFLRNGLKNHQKIHAKEKRFSCPYCPLKFLCEVYLKIHLTTHNSEDLYSCPDCSAKFSFKHDFELHQLTSTKIPCRAGFVSKQFEQNSF